MKVVILFSAVISLVLTAKLPHHEKENLIEEEVTFPPQPYSFGFEVRDDNTTNYQNRAEVADDHGRVKGSYSYVLPDGFVYTITYEDNKDGSGIQTVLKKESSGIQVIIPVQKPFKGKHKSN